MEALSGILRDALVVTALLSLPVLAVATATGTLVAIVQAATQIQEQTLTLLPKLLAVGLVVVLGGGFGMELCAQLVREAIRALPAIVAGP
ncbi:MAG: flagellar biosynthetic protein FliQ [Vulcanimicrobiaceae bacterium]